MSPERRPQKPSTMHAGAMEIIHRLREAGHVAFFAGGCVRDMLMGKHPEDIDVATSAHPEQVCDIFRRTQKVGAQFGVVLVRQGPFAIEVATFRSDLDYQDGRHPSAVRFTTAQEDALRRDFTINGMFYDPISREIIDYVDGQADLRARVIRAIGQPRQRFEEDHLRILRAIRFAARFGFTIESETWQAMSELAASVRRISPERIREELEKILTHPSRSQASKALYDCEVVRYLWTGAEALVPHRQVVEKLIAALPPVISFELGLSVLLHALPVEQVERACWELRCSNHTRKTTCWLIEKQEVLLAPEKITLADLKLLMAHSAFELLLTLGAAKVKERGLEAGVYESIRKRIAAIAPEDIAPVPWVDGSYLLGLGLPQGPIYRQVLERVYYAQLNGDVCTPKEAQSMTRRMIDETQEPANG